MYQGAYTLYSSQTLDASIDPLPLDGVSRMCLSCHDGTIAVDSLVNTPNRSWIPSADHMKMSDTTSPSNETCGFCHVSAVEDPPNVDVAPSFITTDLSDDHPVSFVYDDDLANADGGLELPSTAPSGLGSTIQSDMLFSGRVECPSCHNVHDPDIFPFLIKPNINSSLCVTCHTK
jgi:predicted CXXCH cytochrome family protein